MSEHPKQTFDLIVHSTQTYWGKSYNIMESQGNGVVRTYSYDDEPDVLYIADLSVSENRRHQGLGTHLLQECEEIARNKGISYTCLRVDRSAWMYRWYQNLGYIYTADDKERESHIWMKKRILK